jgi:hypothetical protein
MHDRENILKNINISVKREKKKIRESTQELREVQALQQN